MRRREDAAAAKEREREQAEAQRRLVAEAEVRASARFPRLDARRSGTRARRRRRRGTIERDRIHFDPSHPTRDARDARGVTRAFARHRHRAAVTVATD